MVLFTQINHCLIVFSSMASWGSPESLQNLSYKGPKVQKLQGQWSKWSRGVPPWRPWSPCVGRQKRNRLQRELRMRRRWPLEIAGVRQNDQLETVDPCWPMLNISDDLKWLELTMILWYFNMYFIILDHTLWYTFIQEHNASLAQFYDVLHDLCSPNWHHAMGFSCQAEAAQPSPEKEPAPSLWPWPKAYFGNWYLPISPQACPNAWYDTMSLILEKLSRRFTMLYDVILCYTAFRWGWAFVIPIIWI